MVITFKRFSLKSFPDFSDKEIMTVSPNFFSIFLGVISDFKVIATLIAFILVIMIASFIANYTKKPPRPKKQSIKAAPAPAPKPQEEESDSESDDEAAE